MTKIVFMLFFLIQGPNGEEQLKNVVYDDIAQCEYQRLRMKSLNIKVAQQCQRVEINYEH